MAQNQDFSGFVFLDIETTGLEPHDDEILEVGIVLTNLEFEEVDAESWLIATEEAQSALRNMLASDPDGYVSRMHKDSGLADELLHAKAERSKRSYMLEIIDWLSERDAVGKPLCGSSVGSLDRPFLKHHMRELNDVFHYRSGDASAIRVFVQDHPDYAGVWDEVTSRAESGTKGAEHRVLADSRHSAALVREFFKLSNFGTTSA